MSRWTDLRDRAVRWLLHQIGYYDSPSPEDTNPLPAEPPSGKTPPAPAQPEARAKYAFGLASCWDGANASRRMMNVLSPKMPVEKVAQYCAWMRSRGCTHAHVILANGGDGECAGYAAWRDADYGHMVTRLNEVRNAGFRCIPWLVTDDSDSLRAELFKEPAKLIAKMELFLRDAPLVVLGLEMDEGDATYNQWKKVRDALKKVYSGPTGVHHKSGNGFPCASLGDVVLGQLNPGCTAAQVKSQIATIKRIGKRAVGFEYARGAKRDLAQAALDAGAEGVGNW